MGSCCCCGGGDSKDKQKSVDGSMKGSKATKGSDASSVLKHAPTDLKTLATSKRSRVSQKDDKSKASKSITAASSSRQGKAQGLNEKPGLSRTQIIAIGKQTKKNPVEASRQTSNSQVKGQEIGGQTHLSVIGVKSDKALSRLTSRPAASMGGKEMSRAFSISGTSVLASNSIPSSNITSSFDPELIRKTVVFHDKLPNHLSVASSRAFQKELATTRLFKDQNRTKTGTGEEITKLKCPFGEYLTHKKLKRMQAKNAAEYTPDINKILHEPFCKLDRIVDGLFLTGFFGLVQEELKKEKVALIINATSSECPLLKDKNIASYRVPVSDSTEENISLYFDDVADLIEATRRKGAASVVHCMAGVSRSVTLVLAYLLKYTNLDLRQAFRLVTRTRTIVKPNPGFWRQLIEYELKVKGVNSTTLVELNIGGNKIRLPDFYKNEYPSLYEHEENKAKAASQCKQ